MRTSTVVNLFALLAVLGVAVTGTCYYHWMFSPWEVAHHAGFWMLVGLGMVAASAQFFVVQAAVRVGTEHLRQPPATAEPGPDCKPD
jgi:hypothetical protein